MMSDISVPDLTPSHSRTALGVRRPARLRGVALPNEHGAWGMVFEPLVGAMGVAFSGAAPWIALVFVGAFLMRQPLKVLLAQWKAGRKLPQAELARKFMFYFAGVFAAGAVGTLVFAKPANLLPLLVAAPLAAVQIYYDAVGRSRRLAPELAGAVAISSSAAVIAMAGGWPIRAAAALWAILICRSIPSILYVRNRLLLEKGKQFAVAVPVVASACGVIVTAALAFYGLSPRLPAVMMAILFIRAAAGLSTYSKRRKAMQIGVFEVLFEAGTVLAIILGYRIHI